MKRTLITFLFVSCLLFANGQDKLDSLLQALPKAKHDTDRVLTLYRIGGTYMDSNPDTSILFGQIALNLSHQIKFRKGEAFSLVLIGNNLWKKGDYSKAFEHHLEALKIFEEIKYTKGIASSYNNLALIYEEQRDYKKALENFIKAKDYYEQLRAAAKDPQEAVGVDENLLIVLMNIGNDYEKINKLDSALFYQGKAHALAIHNDDKQNIGNILTNLGNVYLKLDHKDLALSHYRSALPYLNLSNDKQMLSETNYGIAVVYSSLNQGDSAIAFSRAALTHAQEGGYTKGTLYASQLLAEQFEKNKRIDSAFVYMKAALTIKDTLFDENDMREIQVMSMKEQLRQEGIAQERERIKKERVENLQWLSISIFIIIFFGVLLLLSRSKARPKSLRNLGLLGLLLLFEFVSVFLHPFITDLTHHIPILTLLIAVAIASLLLPLHHKMEKWVEHRLAHRKKKSERPKAPTVKKVPLPEAEEQPNPD
jgi:tetratricopeptide (TPR) repeat protein